MESDAELVERTRAGCLEAFETLVRRYERSVLAAALLRVRKLHLAEDVAQTAFLRAFSELSRLRDGGRFGPWLMQIVRNVSLDEIRRKNRGDRELNVDVEGPGDGETERLINQEELLAAMDRLPEHERVAIGLRFLDGHPVASVAEITGHSVGTITKQLSRALSRLRDLMRKGVST